MYNQTLGRLLKKQTPAEIVWEANGAPFDEMIEGTPLSLDAAVSNSPEAETRRRKLKAK